MVSFHGAISSAQRAGIRRQGDLGSLLYQYKVIFFYNAEPWSRRILESF